MSKGRVEPYIKSQCCTGRARRALFNPNLHLIIISNPFLQSMTHIWAGTALRQPPVRITTVINNRMHNSGPTRSPVIFTIALYGARTTHLFIWVCALITMAYYHHTVWGTNSAPLCSGLRGGSQWHLTAVPSLFHMCGPVRAKFF